VFNRVAAAEWNDGAFLTVNVSAIDGLPPQVLLEAPIRFMDGLADNWWEAPAEVRHL
jgi:hypothetical protein